MDNGHIVRKYEWGQADYIIFERMPVTVESEKPTWNKEMIYPYLQKIKPALPVGKCYKFHLSQNVGIKLYF